MEGSWIQLEEAKLFEIAEMAGPNNQYISILRKGDIYKQAELTPEYWYDDERKRLFVTTTEHREGTITLH